MEKDERGEEKGNGYNFLPILLVAVSVRAKLKEDPSYTKGSTIALLPRVPKLMVC